MHTFVGQLAEF